MPIFTVPSGGGGGGGTGPPGPAKWSHTWGFNGRVPGGSGLRALRSTQGRTAFQVGIFPEAGSVLTGLTLSVNAPDPSRAYVLEVLSDPTNTAVVVASVPLAIGQRQVRISGLSVALATDYGLQLRRTSGTGQSAFNSIMATANGEVP